MEVAPVSEIYDFAVLGGGPAGTSSAISAAMLGWRVVLLEAGAFPRHKVCGEFVSGEALSILEGLLGPADVFTGVPRVSKTRIFIDDRVAELPVAPSALSIPRYHLDLTLWRRAIEAGVHVRDRSPVKHVRREGNCFAISSAGANVRARVAIDATGRWSKLRSARPADPEKWIGLKGHYDEEDKIDSCDLYFFSHGYCGVQPLGDGRVNAAAMVRAESAHNLTEVFALSQALKRRTRGWRAASDPVSTAPLFFAPPRTTDREMALVGDAAAFIDPFAGDGISIALHSGRMAAHALSAHLRNERSLAMSLEAYDRQYRSLIQPALRNAAKLRFLLHLPKPLRVSALTLLRFPILARAAVQQTRIRRTSNSLETQPAASRLAS